MTPSTFWNRSGLVHADTSWNDFSVNVTSQRSFIPTADEFGTLTVRRGGGNVTSMTYDQTVISRWDVFKCAARALVGPRAD